MNARFIVTAFMLFAVAAALGAGFVVFGPVMLIRVFGAIALVCGTAGCALQIYALRQFTPRAYALVHRRLARRLQPGMATGTQRTVLAGYR